MSKRNILSNKNIVGTHTTIIEAALDVVEYIASLGDVKISPGIITQTSRNGGRAIRFTATQTGALMKVLGNRSLQSFYIYTANSDSIINAVKNKFPEKK